MKGIIRFLNVTMMLIVITVNSVNVFADSIDLGEYVPANSVVLNEIEYILYDNGEAYLINADENIQGEVIIPSYVTKNGKKYKVVNISSVAFCWCEQITKISLSQTLSVIEDNAFANCINLIEIQMPNTLSKLGRDCFSFCEKLEKINLPEGIEDIEHYTFDGCRKLKEITIPKSVKRIREGVFWGCVELEEVILLNPDTRIHKEAFSSDNVNIVNWNGRTCKSRLETKNVIINGSKACIQFENEDED